MRDDVTRIARRYRSHRRRARRGRGARGHARGQRALTHGVPDRVVDAALGVASSSRASRRRPTSATQVRHSAACRRGAAALLRPRSRVSSCDSPALVRRLFRRRRRPNRHPSPPPTILLARRRSRRVCARLPALPLAMPLPVPLPGRRRGRLSAQHVAFSELLLSSSPPRRRTLPVRPPNQILQPFSAQQ